MRLKILTFLATMLVSINAADVVTGVTINPIGQLNANALKATNLTALAIVGTDSGKKLVSSTTTVAELNAIHNVPLASAASVVSLALTVGGKQDAFITGVGITNNNGVLSFNVAAGANISLSTNANGQIVIASTSGGGGGGGPISDGNYGDVTVSGTGTIFTINPNVVGNTKLAQMAQGTVKLRPSTAGLGNPTDGTSLPWADTGDVTRPAESRVLTIAPGAVTLAQQANMATASIVGRNTAGAGPPEILSTLPNAVQDNITRLGTVTSGTLSYLLLPTRTLTAGAGLSGGGTLAADRTFTLDLSTFVGNVTLWDGSQATRTITYSLSGATDPVWTIGNNSVDLTTGVLKAGGNQVATLNGTETLANKTLTTPIIGAATGTSLTVADDPYDATGWNGSTAVPTKNAIRDKIEALISSAQTPWTADEDANQHSLTNLASIQGGGTNAFLMTMGDRAISQAGYHQMQRAIPTNTITTNYVILEMDQVFEGLGYLQVVGGPATNPVVRWKKAVEGTDYESPGSTNSVTNKTFDAQGTGNVLKFLDWKDFVYPHRVDGVGSTIVTNNYSSGVGGLVTFAGTGGTNANYAFFRAGVQPYDLNTGVTMKLRGFAVRLGGTDTGSASFTICYYSPAALAAFSPTDFTGNSGYVTFTTGTIGAHSAEAVFYFPDITLSWESGWTAGRPILLGIARDGGDANNDPISIVAGAVEFGRIQ